MKSILLLSSILFALSATSQTTTYKTNKWGNTKQTQDHDWATALDNPVKENVTIIETPTAFKATFGQKIKVYKIVNSSKMDEDTRVYNTTDERQTLYHQSHVHQFRQNLCNPLRK